MTGMCRKNQRRGERGNERYLLLIKGNNSDICVVFGTRIESVGKGAKA